MKKLNNENFKLVGIIGKPLKQSMSPYLHNYWIKQNKINATYVPLLINKVNNLNEAMKTFEILGLNVTVPYKKKVIKELDYIDKSAKDIEAVNTVVYENKKIKGYNTDILGFEKGLINKKWNKNRHVVVFGAGGAAEAVLHFLNTNKIKKIILVNRTFENAKKIIQKYNNVVFSDNYNDKIIKEAGLIVNTSCLGMIGYPDLKINLKPANKEVIIYDIVYNPINTKLIIDAKKEKIQTINGLDMFIEQAKSSFEIWFNIRPKTDSIFLSKIKKKLKNL